MSLTLGLAREDTAAGTSHKPGFSDLAWQTWTGFDPSPTREAYKLDEERVFDV